MGVRVAALMAAAVLAAACSGCSDDPENAPAPTQPDGEQIDFDVNGHSMQMQCSGSGAPTVVMVSGLGEDRHTWDPLVPDIASHSKVCTYDRAGLGNSEPSADAAPSAGSMADELSVLLQTAGVPSPYVVVGHSYGGMIARVFAHEHADEVAGLLLVDSATEGEFTDDFFADIDWVEAGVDIDTATSGEQLQQATNVGSLPLVVLTQGQMGGGRFADLWTQWQKDLAAISTNSVHVSATESGHFIQEDQPDLVLQGVADLVASAGSGAQLPACDNRYTTIDGACLP